jgi:pyridoxine 5-phosphate synthase
MTRLSVNINKIATLRNARGGNNPDVVKVALDCEHYGAQGITVHPRPDERHITFQDVFLLKDVVSTELNIEGFPDKRYFELLEIARPAQATLVPDAPEVVTSNQGWDTIKNRAFLKEVVAEINRRGIRSSIFIEPVPELIEAAAEIGTKRIEFYTEPYASAYVTDPEKAILPYVNAARLAISLGLELNAGHDLSLENLSFLIRNIPDIREVSIGHALVCDALYYGLENTIQMYLRKINSY